MSWISGTCGYDRVTLVAQLRDAQDKNTGVLVFRVDPADAEGADTDVDIVLECVLNAMTIEKPSGSPPPRPATESS